MMLKTNINLLINKFLLNNKNSNKSEKNNFKNNYKTSILKINYYYKLFLYNKLKNIIRKKLKYTLKNRKKLQKVILNINRTSLTLKKNRIFRYRVVSCIGFGDKWAGIGDGKNRLFKNSYIKSINTSKKNIYNFNFNCNDYKQLKYKGCKFKAINTVENKNNINIYENIFKISGIKKIKLISYSSKTPINTIKSVINLF